MASGDRVHPETGEEDKVLYPDIEGAKVHVTREGVVASAPSPSDAYYNISLHQSPHEAVAPRDVKREDQTPILPAYYKTGPVQQPAVPYGAPSYHPGKGQQQPLPVPSTYNKPPRRSRSPCCCFLLCLFSIFTIITTVLAIIVLVIWLVLQPQKLGFNIDNVRISGFDLTSASLTVPATNITLEIVARNPNKKIKIYYDEIDVTVQTMGHTIGEGEITAGFYQGHKNTTYLSGDIQSGAVVLDQASQTNLLNAVSAGSVPLYVKVDMKVRYKIGSWNGVKYTEKLRCDIDINQNIPVGSQIIQRRCTLKRSSR